MRPIVLRSLLPASLILLLAAVIAYQAGGAAMIAGQPSAVVTVDLATVLKKLDQHTQNLNNLNEIAAKLKTEDEQRKAEIQKMSDDRHALSDSQAKDDLQDKIALAMLNHKAWIAFSESKLDIEAALRMENLYRNIKAEVDRMAAASGYDLVLVDDSQGELRSGNESRLNQIMQQIAGRRVLYSNKTIDITDELIDRMNNAHRTAGPAPAPK